ncbi:beta-N-acetylhexosaminidase [Chitinophaga sp. MM2321]|uniref:beta-N-acetylhexosaminidase n=1 Tax=Chitinophaga sp. MM2321 TaxID=3137178 RepID=UPI0032D57A66
MRSFFLSLLGILLFLQNNAQQNAEQWRGPHTLAQLHAAPVALIPFPQQVEWHKEPWTSKGSVVIAYAATDTVKNAVRVLEATLSAAGIKTVQRVLKAGDPTPVGAIRLQTDKHLATKAEGYALRASAAGVVITGKDAAGLFYGVGTLKQLLLQQNNIWTIPGCTILDWPAFGLRGLMHDTGRNFQEISALKHQIDILSTYKYNTFHWHLTDNPAWRPQSRIFPQLNEAANRRPTRDPELSYSFDDIRELIAYARERYITVIPELDMPGHSAYFEPTFGFKMGSEQGMAVLEKLLDEFCDEIPAADCPVIHLGSDEVHIPDPEAFMRRMSARVIAHGRKVMIWNPGLKAPPGSIEQLWWDVGLGEYRASDGNPMVDSYAGYLNSRNALNLVQRYFFQQPCGRKEGDSMALGGILCCWPDVRVDDKEKILLHNPVWPGAITYSEAVWCGRPTFVKTYLDVLPDRKTIAWQHFNEFEQRLANHRDRFFKKEPFPFVAFSDLTWQLYGPYIRTNDQPDSATFAPEKAGSNPGKAITVPGGIVMVKSLIEQYALADSALETIYVTTEVFSNTAREIHAWIGFETAARSDRMSAGIPAAGQWDANGGTILVNNKAVPAPQWLQPGANRSLMHSWGKPAEEVPYTDEEFYWSRPPAALQLKKGWNKIMMRVPRSYKRQNWMCVFVPVKLNGDGRWVEDRSLGYRK